MTGQQGFSASRTSPAVRPSPGPDSRTSSAVRPSPGPDSRTLPAERSSPEPGSRTSPAVRPSPEPDSRTSPAVRPSPGPDSRTSPASPEPDSRTSPAVQSSPEPDPRTSSAVRPSPGPDPRTSSAVRPSPEPDSRTSPAVQPSPEPDSRTSPAVQPSPEPDSRTSPAVQPSPEPGSCSLTTVCLPTLLPPDCPLAPLATPQSLPPGTPVTTGPLWPDRFTALPLVSITAVSDSASLYRFLLPSGTSLRLPPGAYLHLRAADPAGRVITRAYGLVSPSQAEGYFEVHVRRYAAGAMSACVRRWRPGQLALWSGPFGGYRPRPGDSRLVLLAAGTGVAPFVGLVRAAVEEEEGGPPLTLLLAVRRLQDVFPRQKLAQWARHRSFTYQLFVSGGREGEGGEKVRYGEPIRWRRLERQDVLKVVNQTAGRTRYLVCGMHSFQEAVQSYLWEAGVTNEDIFVF